MRAAIEAAGATDHKRRTKRSSAAQTILDSDHGEVKVSVTAVGAGDDFGAADEDGDEGEGKETETGDGDGGSGSASGGAGGATRSGDGSEGGGGFHTGRASSGGGGSGMVFYGNHYRFGRVRRVVADLLRDLGGMVDTPKKGGVRGGGPGAADADGGGGGNYGNVDAEAVEKLVTQFEILEDELASVSAARAQSEAQAKVLLATLQKANTKADR